MANRLQHLRGSEAEHSTFTGAKGEISLVTDTSADRIPTGEVRVHDGTTAGGLHVIGAARAWVNFNGTLDENSGSLTVGENVLIRASYNVSSVYYNGTGDYTINFTTAMPDANYAVSGTASRPNNTSTWVPRIVCLSAATPPTSSGARINVDYGSGTTGLNEPFVTVTIFR
jgi:hypothetical protein